ncbi:deoxyguanosinetriphosphate triphosphohydrolase [bacterium]|nr:deoxyguanosinetriphosphate triphosphohydrolase [bacterium]
MIFEKIKKQRIDMERTMLCDKAVIAESSRGRRKTEPDEADDFRTAFQKDRDRIIHSAAFRRLKDKSQVFVSIFSSYFRTRLTHSLEVSQISRTVARALQLNEDLTEAIALGHDLGHAPFGHVGERVLNRKFDGEFRHSVQSLRVVDLLEKKGIGLNLTFEVRDGILKHSKPPKNIFDFVDDSFKEQETLEGQIVKICDSVAYINHDIDDAARAKLLKNEDLPKEPIKILGDTHAKRINTMVRDIISASRDLEKIQMSEKILGATNKIRDYLYENLYNMVDLSDEIYEVIEILETLYDFYIENPEKMGEGYLRIFKNFSTSRQVTDFIAGMTDTSVIKKYLKVTKWMGKSPPKSFENRLQSWIGLEWPQEL